MEEKILFVDDDPNILSAYQRQLRKQFTVDTALGGDLGLTAIANHGPYSVIVADMGMPGMNGIQFLSKVKE
ncbi:MAG: response regulator, partial [Planctomycetota bacterium]